MKTTLKIRPLQKEKFKHVLNLSNELKITNISILSEGDDFFEIEYQKEQDLFSLGRCFEPFKMGSTGSFQVNYDNSYINSIR